MVISAALTLLIPVIMVLAFGACFSRHAQYDIWDYEDSISDWFDSYIVTFDETSADETSDDGGIDYEVWMALLEYGLNPEQFYIDPMQPNVLQRKW